MSLPEETSSSTLPKEEQDANIAGTHAARPGPTDSTPAGISESTASTNTASVSDAIKGSLDSIAQQTPSTQSVTEQLPSTQSITEQLPSAQGAADAVRAGASSLIAGISNLAVGLTSATSQNAAAPHQESVQARDIDDLHVPGGFDDTTTDHEDKIAVQDTLRSAYQSIPSIDSVKQLIPSTELGAHQLPGNASTGSLTNQAKSMLEQVQGGTRSTQNPAQQSTEEVKQELPAEQSTAESTRIHQDGTDHIKNKLEEKDNATINTVGTNSTTTQLAGQVPLEPRGVPQVVADNQRQADGAALLDRAALSSAGPSSSTAELAGQVPLEQRGVPSVVAESQRKAGVAPEASANPEAVSDKKQVDEEIKREVVELNSTSGNGAGATVGQAVMGGLGAIGTAATGAATYARHRTQEATGTDPVSLLPESTQRKIDSQTVTAGQDKSYDPSGVPQVVQESQRRAGTGPEAAANPDAVLEKSEVEQELKSAVTPAQATSSGNTLTGALGGNLTSAATSASTFAREKTNELAENVLPQSVQRSIGQTASSSGADSSGDRSAYAGADSSVPNVGSSVATTAGEGTGGLLLPRLTGIAQSTQHDGPSQGGIHNGVVGAGSGEPLGLAEHGTSSLTRGFQSTGPNASVGVSHITLGDDVDLSAGVKNGVIGTGSGHQ